MPLPIPRAAFAPPCGCRAAKVTPRSPSSAVPFLLRVLVVDDQPLARLRLRDLLDERADIRIVGEASDVPTALALIAELRPDVAFVDIHMPGPSGLEILRTAEPKPLVVFTTAHDQHAVTAFELNALDYLLKPFGARRLSEAIVRARERLPLLRRATGSTRTCGSASKPPRRPERPYGGFTCVPVDGSCRWI